MPSTLEVKKFVKEGNTSYNSMRFLLILIFCPTIYDENQKSNFIKLTNLIPALKPDQKECLSRWLVSMDGDKLNWIVKFTQKAITI